MRNASLLIATCGLLVLLAADRIHGEPAPSTQPTAVVTGVRELRPHQFFSDRFGLNSVISVQVRDLGAWPPARTSPDRIIPYIGGIALKGVHPMAVNLESGTVIFHLSRNGLDGGSATTTPAAAVETHEAWSQLLKNPVPWHRRRSVGVSIGLPSGEVLPVKLEDVQIQKDVKVNGAPPAAEAYSLKPDPQLVVFPLIGWLFLIADLLAIVFFVVVARRSDLLRDADADLPDDAAAAGARKPYSLGRTQLALWFFSVLTAFIGLWVVTGEHSTLTASSLGLLGISAGTFVTAALIDTNKKGRRATSQLAMARVDEEIVQSKAVLAAATPGGADAATLQAKLASLQTRRDQLQAQLQALQNFCQPSQGFFKDLLSVDGEGLSLHRCQIAGWTVVLVAVFLLSTYSNLAMPEFGAELLTLMGISSGTYLLLKGPENTA